MRRGEIEPGVSQHEVLRDALSFVVHQAEKKLGGRKILFRRKAHPTRGGVIILGHAAAMRIHEAEIGLGPRVAFDRQRAKIFAERI